MRLTIFHTNDTHGVLVAERNEYCFDVGGVSIRSAMLKEFRREYANNPHHHVMVLDGGDILESDILSHFYHGEPDVLAMNAMGYNAMTLGNHDFGYKIEALQTLQKLADFPFLSCNLTWTETGEPFCEPYIIREYDGRKIAILGATSHTVMWNIHRDDRGRIQYEDATTAVSRYVKELCAKSVDYLIFLSHLGIEEDRNIAANIEGIDLIIGAHSHTLFEEPEYVNNCPIVHAGRYSQTMGRVDLYFPEIGSASKPELQYRAMEMGDSEMGKLIEPYYTKLMAKVDQPLSELPEEIHTRNKCMGPAPLNQMVLQLILEETGADVAVATAVSVRGSLGPGMVLLKDLYDIMPFDNYVTTLQVTGRDIRALLHYNQTKIDSPFYLQIRGIELTNQEQTDGTIAGIPIDDDKTYKMVTDNFMAAGGGRDEVLENIQGAEPTSTLIRSVLESYLRRR
jgi:5'-nucleotidase